jgi:Arc/MetJ family transcription regulator
MADLEELQLEIEEKLLSLSSDELIGLGKGLKLEETSLVDKRKLELLKLIRKNIDEGVEAQEENDAKMKYLVTVKEQLNDEPPPLEPDTSNEGNMGNLTVEVPEESKKAEVEQSKFTVYRREFKIIGIVGPDTQKDRLSFVSLTRQIDSGKAKGYSEPEIVEAIIRAISPTLKLRSYVETIENLKLGKLLQVLKAHYKQKSAAELYQELTVTCQGPKETAEDFLVRVLELRQQVLFTSRVMEDGITYSADLVQAVLLRTLETGFNNEAVRAKLRPLLKNRATTDEELIKQTSDAVSEETERASKLSVSSRRQQAKVGCTTCECNHQTDGREQNKGHPSKTESIQKVADGKQQSLISALEAIRSDVASLKSSMKSSSENNQGAEKGNWNETRRRPRKSACVSCQEQGKDDCYHCYVCGSSEHYARGCKKRPSGNGRGLHPRDRK